MSVDFFTTGKSMHTHAKRFGLCDADADPHAKISESDGPDAKWIAVVHNVSHLEVRFLAVDKCVPLLRKDGTQDRRCDGLLTYREDIDFVELKDKGANWLEDSANQLEVTIRHFAQNHDLMAYKRRRAFAVNRAHPHFQHHSTETKERFRDQLKVRLFAQQDIHL